MSRMAWSAGSLWDGRVSLSSLGNAQMQTHWKHPADLQMLDLLELSHAVACACGAVSSQLVIGTSTMVATLVIISSTTLCQYIIVGS